MITSSISDLSSALKKGVETNINNNSPVRIISKASSFWNMFGGCTSYEGMDMDIDVSSSTHFHSMFLGCTNFNSPNVVDWQIGSKGAPVQTYFMFSECPKFNQDISGWDTTGVDRIDHMFKGASIFDQDLSAWDISDVTATLSELFTD